jgi:hypothetical protein
MLAEETSEDQHYRTRFGTQLWQRPSSQIANRPLREQESEMLQTFEPATQSDRSVKERYDNWRKAIELLCQDEVGFSLPGFVCGYSLASRINTDGYFVCLESSIFF